MLWGVSVIGLSTVSYGTILPNLDLTGIVLSIPIQSPCNCIDIYRNEAPAAIQVVANNNIDMPEVVDDIAEMPEAIDNNSDIPEDMDDIPDGSSASTSPTTALTHLQDRKKERVKLRRARKLARRYEHQEDFPFSCSLDH